MVGATSASFDGDDYDEVCSGPCKGKKFLIRRGLDVTIEKEGKGALAVTSLFIEADGVTSPPGLRCFILVLISRTARVA